MAALPNSPDVIEVSSSAWISRHARLGFDADDVAALISSIDSSQNALSLLVNLPAELLLHVLEYVPVDHILDWRYVCRGFRDAIDGRILYHHLQRTELVGYLGPRSLAHFRGLDEEQYDQIRFLRASFLGVEGAADDRSNRGPIWGNAQAVFKLKPDPEEDGASIGIADAEWRKLERLGLNGVEEGFGTLRWCIRLDQAVLDLDFPLEATRSSFGFAVDLDKSTIRVAWKDMLFRFLKTEAALRRMMTQKQGSNFTFSLAEDCLRHVRRQRLHASLDPDKKVDRHLKWSLRLLPPLFGKPRQNHSPLELAEVTAVDALLYLRREASMSTKYIAYVNRLRKDLKAMATDWDELEKEFGTFRTHLFPMFARSLIVSTEPDEPVPYNPVAWPDDLRARIEERVGKWKSQKKVMEQMRTLLASSNQALSVPEDGFDDVFSDI